jgi:hypothetical protein
LKSVATGVLDVVDMDETVQSRMLNAVYACLLPLVRMLLRSGITYQQFDAVVKRAFVREALAEVDLRGRPANTSRVAVKTGLSRKDAKRIRDLLTTEQNSQSRTEEETHSGPPARVLHAWHTDANFLNVEGRPVDLEFQGATPSFCSLVRAVAGDVPPGAVKAELKRAGAVLELVDGKLRAAKRHFVPGNVDEKAIVTVSGMLYPLTAGLAHNADPGRTTGGFIQRIAFSDRLDKASAMDFRHWSRDEATKFIELIDDWLAHRETSVDEQAPQESRFGTVGVGVFYYEGPTAEQAIKVTATI